MTTQFYWLPSKKPRLINKKRLMLLILFILFFLIPLIEVTLFVQLGSLIGVWQTIFLVVLTAVIGAFLIRWQGISTLLQIRQQLGRGEVPAQAMFDGVALLVAGAFLMTPGFFTDAIGFILLVPAFRQAVFPRLLSKVLHQQAFGKVHLSTVRPGHSPFKSAENQTSDDVEILTARQSRVQSQSGRQPDTRGRVIEGEITDKDA